KMKSLAYGKIDAIFNNLISGQKYIKQGAYSNIKVLDEIDDKIVKKEDLRVGVKKEDAILFSIINKSMEAISRQEKEEIINKWFAAKLESSPNENSVKLSNNEKKWLEEDNVVKIWVGLTPPFQMYENNKFDGISVEYIKRVFKKHNIKYKFISAHNFPWKQALEDISNKKGVDLLLTAKITPNREKNMLFTDNYLSSPWVIFTRNDSDFISGMENLKGKVVAVPNGFVMHEMLKRDYPNINLKVIEGVNSMQKSVKALAVGDVDAYIENLTIGSYLAKSLSLDNIKVAAPSAFGNHENAMAVRDDWGPLVSIINKELRAMSVQDKDEIYNKYLSMEYDYGISIWDIIKWVAIVSLIFITIMTFIVKSNRKLNKEIKKRKKSEKILKVTNEKFNALFELSPLGLVLTNMNGDFIEFNKAFEKICGYSKEELHSLSYWKLTPKKFKKQEDEQLKSLSNTGFYGPYEKEYIQKDGTIIPINLNGIAITDSDNKQYIWSIIEDITNRKRDEQIILEQSKMVAMGEMIGNIAHQWRQPLSIISTAATGMQMQKEHDRLSNSDFNNACELIDRNAQFLSKTIDAFKDFIKGDEKKTLFNLHEEIDNFLSLVKASTLSHNINVILEENGDININGYGNMLTQVLINIFTNAKDAFANNKIKEDNKLIIISTYCEKDRVIIRIKDNAGGIPINILPRIFEPYFTTKHKSQGAGLGLHMTYNLIINSMGGTIEAFNSNYTYKSNKYKGAEFIIMLPLQ
ncbi:MAG: transporter substrate-binding domain-containing protein, partial [Arcobacteraceae bacterium]